MENMSNGAPTSLLPSVTMQGLWSKVTRYSGFLRIGKNVANIFLNSGVKQTMFVRPATHDPYICGLCYSKCGLGISNVSITWELARNAGLEALSWTCAIRIYIFITVPGNWCPHSSLKNTGFSSLMHTAYLAEFLPLTPEQTCRTLFCSKMNQRRTWVAFWR